MKMINRLVATAALLFTLAASVPANAGTMTPWSLSAPWTAPAGVYNQPFAGYIAPPTGNFICGNFPVCHFAFVQVTIKHPQQAQIQPYVNLQGAYLPQQGVETLPDGSLRYTFHGPGPTDTQTPIFSVHVKSNSGAGIVIDPALGHVLGVGAGNAY